MRSAAEEIQARAEKYQRVEFERDELGRMIGVRQLKPSQQLKIQGMSQDLDGTTAQEDPDNPGVFIQVPKSLPLIMAASVCQIDEIKLPFPRDRRELDALLDRLDGEGLAAAGVALGKFAPKKAKAAAAEAAEAGDDLDEEDEHDPK